MADYINKIRTTEGDKPVNYEALANKPNSLPNPNKIKFTGSVVAEYDGSSEVTVNIPNGASEEQVAQIQTNTNDISELKNKTSELKTDIKELSDKKITKFYASNLGNTTLNDSDNGKITDMIIFGKTIQDGTPTPDAPVEIQSVVNPVVKVCGKNLVQKVIYGYINQSNQINIDNNSTSVIAYLEKEKTYKISCSKAFDRLKIGKLERSDVVHGIHLKNVYEGNISTKTFIANFTGYACIYIKSVKDRDIINSIQIEEGTVATDYEPYKEQSATLPITLNAIPVSSGGNVTIDGQQYITDYVDIENKKLHRYVDSFKFDETVSIIDNMDLLLATPTITDLTDEEIQGFIELATYYPTTNVFVTSDQLDGYTEFNYPVSLAEGWNYVKQQLGDTREYIYDMDLQSAEAYINSEYAVSLTELEV